MSTKGEAYLAEKLAENLTAAARAARVKEFIADSGSEIIADLFAVIRDAMIERESDELLSIAKHYRSAASVLSDVEANLLTL